MRVSQAAVALITRINERGATEHLSQWNAKWRAYSLIGGHREEGETFRDCCIREIVEELGIRPSQFKVAKDPAAPICEFIAFSQSASELTHYQFQTFCCQLTKAAELKIGRNEQNRWLTMAEIERGQTADGRPVAEQVKTLLANSFFCEQNLPEEPMGKRTSDVNFSEHVREKLTEELLQRLTSELQLVFTTGRRSGQPRIFVPRLFSGFNPNYEVKIILAAEVTCEGVYERHIVKLGNRDEVAGDFTGWQECTQGRMVASRIFAPVRPVELSAERLAVVYRDAFSLFGPEDEGHSTESAPKLLEEAIKWAVKDNEPSPLSAQRAIAHVYTDLGLWFYRGAKPNQVAADSFYRRRLHARSADPAEKSILSLWEGDAARAALRRHAVWVLCGRDVPDADPESKPARYLDPIDYMRWALRSNDGERLPSTLVGRAHGDLHGRNILVGVRRGEVQYPAVFDYGDMSSTNVLAWDFAKLETELKVRLLSDVLHHKRVMSLLVERSKIRQSVVASPRDSLPSENSERADRLAAYLAFEELLDEATRQIDDKHEVERVRRQKKASTGSRQLDRLLAILLRIRQEAAYWLGFKTSGRQTRWKDELYFALAVYGLLNVRWDYSVPEQEAALISSGVALARSDATSKLLKSAIASGPRPDGDYPSYRVPLAICYADWKQKQHQQGCEFVENLVLNMHRNDKSRVQKIEVRPAMQHAVPLVGQSLLLELEAGNQHAVEPVLERMRTEARTFHDFETLARVGRVYKDAGDRQWEAELKKTSPGHSQHLARPAWLQMYDKSFEVYREAYELTKDWYVGINAATLALLTGNQQDAEKIAKQVLNTCAAKLDHEKKDRYWLFATEGEASLILNEDARNHYASALSELSPGQWGMADSSYRQAVRLWRLFGADGERRVGPVLTLFETSDAREFLTRGFLGRKFPEN